LQRVEFPMGRGKLVPEAGRWSRGAGRKAPASAVPTLDTSKCPLPAHLGQQSRTT